ncbi:hypothetical protein [Rhodocaloribacter sp.]
MKNPLFPAFPDDASLWIYVADRPLTAGEQTRLLERLHSFFGQWTAHGHRVQGEALILHDRFLLVAGFVPDGALSGCGIDASIQTVKEAFTALSIGFLSALDVLFRDDEGVIRSVPRPTFRRLVRSGAVTAATTVFDPSITSVKALREGGFEKPAGRSWHAKVFRIPEPVA